MAVTKKTRVKAHTRKIKRGKRTRVKAHLRKVKHNIYIDIIKSARKQGLKIPKARKGKGPLAYDEADIPEDFLIDGFTMPIEKPLKSWGAEAAKKQKGKYLIIMDDDAPKKTKKLSFAHELGHVHMFEIKEKPHTEPKAEKYAAKILNISDKEFKKLTEDIYFDQDIHKPGIQLPNKKRKRK